MPAVITAANFILLLNYIISLHTVSYTADVSLVQ